MAVGHSLLVVEVTTGEQCRQWSRGGSAVSGEAHCGAGQGVLHDALHLGLDVALPQALLGTAGVQVV